MASGRHILEIIAAVVAISTLALVERSVTPDFAASMPSALAAQQAPGATSQGVGDYTPVTRMAAIPPDGLAARPLTFATAAAGNPQPSFSPISADLTLDAVFVACAKGLPCSAHTVRDLRVAFAPGSRHRRYEDGDRDSDDYTAVARPLSR